MHLLSRGYTALLFVLQWAQRARAREITEFLEDPFTKLLYPNQFHVELCNAVSIQPLSNKESDIRHKNEQFFLDVQMKNVFSMQKQ